MALPNAFRSDVWVTSAAGQSLVGAHVYWLTQPATIPNAEPPTPLATNYTDSTASVVESQPDITDGFGHAESYLAAGIYTVAIYVNGLLFQVYPDQNVAEAPTSGVTTLNGLTGAVTLAAGTNMSVVTAGNTITFNYTASLGVTSLNGLTGAPVITAGTNISVTPSGSNVQIAYTGTALPTAQLGDVLRYNVNSDTAWDAVSYAQKITESTATSAASTLSVYGYQDGPFQVQSGTITSVAPTATQSWGTNMKLLSSDTRTFGYVPAGKQSANGGYNIMNWQKIYSIQAITNSGSTTRFWWGICVYWNGSSLGTNNTAPLFTTRYTSDTPNCTTIGWRFSGTTDTTVKAVVIVAGASPTQTTVDTGFTPDTNPHTYEMVQNPAGTSITWYIDGVAKATISSNLPSAVPTAPFDALALLFNICDNKNTNQTTAFTFYRAGVEWRG